MPELTERVVPGTGAPATLTWRQESSVQAEFVALRVLHHDCDMVQAAPVEHAQLPGAGPDQPVGLGPDPPPRNRW